MNSKSKSYRVSIIPQATYDKDQISKKMEEYFDTYDYNFQDKTIFLKPSFVSPFGGVEETISTNTNINLVAGIANALSNRGAANIYIAENKTIGTARYAFSMVGIKKVTKAIKNVKFLYLDEEITEEVAVENPFIEDHVINYPKILLNGEIDYFISIPKLKANNYADITLSVKNNFGLINKKERLRYHDDRLHEHLADLLLVREPDLIITDAIIAGEGNGPTDTTPVATEMLIVGENPLAVDTVSCYLMEQNAKDIIHLRILHERGFGPLNIEDIQIENKKYLDAKRTSFVMPNISLAVSPTINLFTEGICHSGCQAFLRTILDSYGNNIGYQDWDNFTIISGKDVKIPQEKLDSLDKKRTIVYGDCVEEYKDYGAFFKGCPPDYGKVLTILSLKTDLPKNPNLEYVNYGKFLWFWMVHFIMKYMKIAKGKLKK